MTAIKPAETRLVRGVASERYPSNHSCSHPECGRPADDQHHCWPRSAIGNDSWFIEIKEFAYDSIKGDGGGLYPASQGWVNTPDVNSYWDHNRVVVIPHVTGLCRTHHTDVEEHRAWIKLEDGVFNWYDRQKPCPTTTGCDCADGDCESPEWGLIGPINPQPGSTEGKPKKKRKPAQPARKKAVYSIRVPKHEGENGYEVLDTLVDGAREKLAPELGQSENVPAYYVIVGALAQVLQS